MDQPVLALTKQQLYQLGGQTGAQGLSVGAAWPHFPQTSRDSKGGLISLNLLEHLRFGIPAES